MEGATRHIKATKFFRGFYAMCSIFVPFAFCRYPFSAATASRARVKAARMSAMFSRPMGVRISLSTVVLPVRKRAHAYRMRWLKEGGAGYGIRTHDLNFGKVAC